MKELELPGYSFKIIEEDGFRKIFDPLRRKFVKLTPEEWVRQNFITYLVKILGYSQGLISVERQFRWNRLQRRSDILVHNRKGEPLILVECKAPDVKVDAEVFDQIMTYNMKLSVPILVVTNGVNHFACVIDDSEKGYRFLTAIPHFNEIDDFLRQR